MPPGEKLPPSDSSLGQFEVLCRVLEPERAQDSERPGVTAHLWGAEVSPWKPSSLSAAQEDS